jgi:hypothetical protein
MVLEHVESCFKFESAKVLEPSDNSKRLEAKYTITGSAFLSTRNLAMKLKARIRRYNSWIYHALSKLVEDGQPMSDTDAHAALLGDKRFRPLLANDFTMPPTHG